MSDVSALKTKEIFAELAQHDPFFAFANEVQENHVTFGLHNPVWDIRPFSGNFQPCAVILANHDARKVEITQKFMQALIKKQQAQPPATFPSPISCSLLFSEREANGRVTDKPTRVCVVFANADSATWFAEMVRQDFGIDTHLYEVTDIGPDTRVFTPHASPQPPQSPAP